MNLNKDRIVATLVLPIREGRVLLAKKTDKIGIGKYNGWGGGVEGKETIAEGALREFQEESGLEALLSDLVYAGEMIFHNLRDDGQSEFLVEMSIFVLEQWQGTPKPNSEMKEPTFWPINKIPFDEMMLADHSWLPCVLEGNIIKGEAWYSPGQKKLLKQTVVKITDQWRHS